MTRDSQGRRYGSVQKDSARAAISEPSGSQISRGLPLVVEVIDEEELIADFLPVVREIAEGALVTMEAVRISRPPATPG